MFVIVLFCLCPHESLRMWILIPFSKSVILSKIAHLFIITTFVSCYSISTTFCRASTIVYTYAACYTINCTSVDSCSSYATMFSSLASFCIVYASIKRCFATSSSFDSSMHTKSIDVALGLVYFLTNQHCLLLHKNSTTRFLIIYVLNYHLHKLYLRIICLHFYTFQR